MSTSNKPTSTEQLDTQLTHLKLSFIQEHYPDLAKEAAVAHWGYVEILARSLNSVAPNFKGFHIGRLSRARLTTTCCG